MPLDAFASASAITQAHSNSLRGGVPATVVEVDIRIVEVVEDSTVVDVPDSGIEEVVVGRDDVVSSVVKVGVTGAKEEVDWGGALEFRLEGGAVDAVLVVAALPSVETGRGPTVTGATVD